MACPKNTCPNCSPGGISAYLPFLRLRKPPSDPPALRAFPITSLSQSHTCPHQGHSSSAARLLEEITLDMIVRGETKSPVGKKDLLKWLEWKELRGEGRDAGEAGGEEALGRMVVEFLGVVELYKTSFEALPQDKSSLAPPPFQAISQLALSNPDIMRPAPARSPNGPNPPPSFSYTSYSPESYAFGRAGHTRGGSIDSFESGTTVTSLRSTESSSSGDTLIEGQHGTGGYGLPHRKEMVQTPAPAAPGLWRLDTKLSDMSGFPRTALSTRSGTTNAAPKPASRFRLPGAGAATPTAGGYAREPAVAREREAAERARPDSTASEESVVLGGTGLGLGGGGYLVGGLGPTTMSKGLNPMARPLSPIPSPSLSPRPMSPSPSILSLEMPASLDPAGQPLRAAMSSLVETYLVPSGPRSLTSLIPPILLSTFSSESALTTHPDVLLPLTTTLSIYVTSTHLPLFLDASAKNLHRHTAMGRLMVGVVCCVVVLAAAVCLIIDPSPFKPDGKVEREWRLTLVPVLLGGVGYGMGAKAGMCFWLALFGVTESPYDTSSLTTRETLLALLTALHLRPSSPSLSSTPRTRPDSLPRPGRKLRKRSASVRSDNLELIHSISNTSAYGHGHGNYNPRARSGSNATTSTFTSGSPEAGPSPGKAVWIMLWRLTGTAWGVEKVQDPILRRYQRKEAWKIAGWLVGVLAVLGVGLYFVPYVELKKT
ncbi:hypothetical protein IAT38_006011 [Cryptococcus sp. DSM 104549]